MKIIHPQFNNKISAGPWTELDFGGVRTMKIWLKLP